MIEQLKDTMAKLNNVFILSDKAMEELCKLNLTEEEENYLDTITYFITPYVDDNEIVVIKDNKLKRDIMFGDNKKVRFKEYKERLYDC